jgi:hypothetical protein
VTTGRGVTTEMCPPNNYFDVTLIEGLPKPYGNSIPTVTAAPSFCVVREGTSAQALIFALATEV